MMRLRMFTVYDSKATAFLPPFYMAASGAAIRSFQDTVNDPTHAFYKHPEDYTLFYLGTFDDAMAAFELLDAPESLGVALTYKDKTDV